MFSIKKGIDALLLQAFVKGVRPLVGSTVKVLDVWGEEQIRLPNGIQFVKRSNARVNFPRMYLKERWWFIQGNTPIRLINTDGQYCGDSTVIAVPECHLMPIQGGIDEYQQMIEKILTEGIPQPIT